MILSIDQTDDDDDNVAMADKRRKRRVFDAFVGNKLS